jgi:hypothetical protein
MGHSIFSDKKQNISLMQFHTSYALRIDNKVTVIGPDVKPVTFSYREPTSYLDKNDHLIPLEHDEEMEKDALAFVLALDHLYDKKLYR